MQSTSQDKQGGAIITQLFFPNPDNRHSWGARYGLPDVRLICDICSTNIYIIYILYIHIYACMNIFIFLCFNVVCCGYSPVDFPHIHKTKQRTTKSCSYSMEHLLNDYRIIRENARGKSCCLPRQNHDDFGASMVHRTASSSCPPSAIFHRHCCRV